MLPAKSLSAGRAFVRTFVRMSALMSLEIPLFREPFVALQADERFVIHGCGRQRFSFLDFVEICLFRKWVVQGLNMVFEFRSRFESNSSAIAAVNMAVVCPFMFAHVFQSLVFPRKAFMERFAVESRAFERPLPVVGLEN